jgi:hypothetical protein
MLDSKIIPLTFEVRHSSAYLEKTGYLIELDRGFDWCGHVDVWQGKARVKCNFAEKMERSVRSWWWLNEEANM